MIQKMFLKINKLNIKICKIKMYQKISLKKKVFNEIIKRNKQINNNK